MGMGREVEVSHTGNIERLQVGKMGPGAVMTHPKCNRSFSNCYSCII